MGYTTMFKGKFVFDKKPDEEFITYINNFNKSRRMKRDVEKIKEIHKDWKAYSFNGDLGIEGEYFVKASWFDDPSIIDGNSPPSTQPGLWCGWHICTNKENNECYIEWDYSEKFYDYIEWLRYLIDNFIKPSGYAISGNIVWRGEDYKDYGTIYVCNNNMTIFENYILEDSPKQDDLYEDICRELSSFNYDEQTPYDVWCEIFYDLLVRTKNHFEMEVESNE